MSRQDQFSGNRQKSGSAGSDDQTAELNAVGTDGETGADTSEQMKSTVQDTVQQVQDTVSRVADQAQQTAGNVLDQVRQTTSSRLEDQKGRAAQSISGAAQVIHEAGRNMPGGGPVAEYVDRAAWQLEHLSNYLQERDVRDLVIDVERFARRQPTLFLAGGFLVGLLGARFLKSSADQAQAGTATPSGTGANVGNTIRQSAGSGYAQQREVVSFTTQGNYTVEGSDGGAGYSGSGDEYGSQADGTIHSTYLVDTHDAGSAEG